jgi:hypothetical protein
MLQVVRLFCNKTGVFKLKIFYSNKVQKLMFYGSGLQIFHKARSHLETEVPEDDAIRIPSEDALILDRHTKFSLL